MATGRAAVFHGPGTPFELREYEVLDPDPGGIVVRVTRANLCGTDLHQWRGEFDIAKFGRPYPQVLGHEMTGRVVALGAGLERDSAGRPLGEGDRVVYRYFTPCGACRACLRRRTRACPNARANLWRSCDEPPHFTGAFADYYQVAPGSSVFKVPDDLDDATVAGVNCALSQVVGGLELAGVGLGDSVVVQGAGGLGIYATAVAKELGAGQVIVVDGVAERLELARAFGADHTVDLAELPDATTRVERVRELTGGWGADVVAELVGHPRVVDEGLAMLGRGGRYLEVGNVSPGATVELDPSTLVARNITVLGMLYYEAEHLAKALDLLDRTRDRYPWDRVVSHAFPLDQIDRAFAAADQGEVTRAAIVP
jgi:threonine dehydrogenase-like Zn-dependent dehydrogenase